MSEDITITIGKETAEALLKIEERYFFDLFKEIRLNEDEEYRFRDAITEIARKVKDERR